MSDDKSPIPSARFTPEPAGADGQKQSPLLINGQYVKDLSFEAPNTPQVFSVLQSEPPAIQVDIDVQAANKQDTLFEVVLKIRAEARAKDQLAYLLEVEYAGLFTVNVQPEHLGPVLLIECPMILFPFLRRIIADITGDGGFAPLMLSPMDFAQLYNQRIQQMQAQQAAGTVTA
jgi:preprotein translocase subunit SecB